MHDIICLAREGLHNNTVFHHYTIFLLIFQEKFLKNDVLSITRAHSEYTLSNEERVGVGNMKRTVWLWELVGFAVTSLLGTLLHFLYDFTGGAIWAAAFSGVNESTFEHMKLLFFPMLAFTLIQGFFFKDYKSFPCVKLRGILIGLALIPLLFYTYNGVIGKSPDFVNIAIFFISAAIAYAYETRALNSGRVKCTHPRLAYGVLIGIALLFVLFTFVAPRLEIFRDPITGEYGI